MRGGMFRLSRDKRLLMGVVSLFDFATTAQLLVAQAKESRPEAVIEVLTCEDLTTYNYSTVSVYADEVNEALKQRKLYTIEELTPAVWQRSLKTEMYIKEKSERDSFMLCLTCDQRVEPKRMLLHGQQVEDALYEQILATFNKPSLQYGIGDGYSKVLSPFSLAVAQRVNKNVHLPT